jgi:hypothetical protein
MSHKPIEIGTVFGSLRALAAEGYRSNGTYWKCRCVCGREISVRADHLHSGSKTSCGCQTPSRRTMKPGDRFGLLTVVDGYVEKNRASVRCQCSSVTIVERANLRNKNTTRCNSNVHKGTHGNTKAKATGAYKTWSAMIQRCTNPRSKEYRNYGGRGIKVCDEWFDFTNFLRDMGSKPEGMTIERINNDQGYSRNNCRWATKHEQCQNTRLTKKLTMHGRTQSLAVWAREAGLRPGAVYKRIKLGWAPERAVTMPASA